jgi:hypothetical protein
MKNEYSGMLIISNRIVQEHSSITSGEKVTDERTCILYAHIRRACGQVLFTYKCGDAHNVDLQF